MSLNQGSLNQGFTVSRNSEAVISIGDTDFILVYHHNYHHRSLEQEEM